VVYGGVVCDGGGGDMICVSGGYTGVVCGDGGGGVVWQWCGVWWYWRSWCGVW
jgi:hypothetical protein